MRWDYERMARRWTAESWKVVAFHKKCTYAKCEPAPSLPQPLSLFLILESSSYRQQSVLFSTYIGHPACTATTTAVAWLLLHSSSTYRLASGEEVDDETYYSITDRRTCVLQQRTVMVDRRRRLSVPDACLYLATLSS